jgi:hypothetical protein
MKFFKKKPQTEKEIFKCPAEGCDFVADDKISLEKHIAWAHPKLKTAP